MLRHVCFLTSVVLLIGCTGGQDASRSQTASSQASPRGNGAEITGRVIKIESDGSLLTDIPIRWLAVEGTLPEGQHLKVNIAGKEFPALWACNSLGSVGEGDWCAMWSRDTREGQHLVNLNFLLVCKERNAATIAGAVIGSEVRLTKVGDPM